MSRKLSRKQQKLEEAKKEVSIVDLPSLDLDDYDAIAKQISHNSNCVQVSAPTQSVYRYAVFYKNQWFFVSYNRDTYKVVSSYPLDILKDPERQRWLSYKSRLEAQLLEKKIKEAKEKDAAL